MVRTRLRGFKFVAHANARQCENMPGHAGTGCMSARLHDDMVYPISKRQPAGPPLDHPNITSSANQGIIIRHYSFSVLIFLINFHYFFQNLSFFSLIFSFIIRHYFFITKNIIIFIISFSLFFISFICLN